MCVLIVVLFVRCIVCICFVKVCFVVCIIEINEVCKRFILVFWDVKLYFIKNIIFDFLGFLDKVYCFFCFEIEIDLVFEILYVMLSIVYL